MEYIKVRTNCKLDVWIKLYNPLRHLLCPPIKKLVPYVYYKREEAEKCRNKELNSHYDEKGFVKNANDYSS